MNLNDFDFLLAAIGIITALLLALAILLFWFEAKLNELIGDE